ncbi:MAG: hypothetical protein LBR36_09500 [Bacteroidales bacterium]|jgi:hypothetical protein|nr:hypothetical protein [Bacteroidales bacterium]
MNYLEKITSWFILVVFVVYSCGIGFFVHQCYHCKKADWWAFSKQDCCSDEEKSDCTSVLAEPQEKSMDACCSGETCCPAKKITKKVKKITSHHQKCCKIEYKFYKIKSAYLSVAFDKSIFKQFSICFLFAPVVEQEMEIANIFSYLENHFPRSDTSAGEKKFLYFIHSLVVYG